ncbi:MAG: hypothetical protein ABR502_01885 [Chitinophagaceae bacterium]
MFRMYFVTIVILISACTNDNRQPDVSDIKVDVKIERFEQSFFSIDTNNLTTSLNDVRKRFPAFYPVFMLHILGLNEKDPSGVFIIRNVVSSYGNINDQIEKKYNNLKWLQKELTQNLKYVKYYYPQYPIPRFITFIGTLDAPGIVLTHQYLGIGLHQFAGKDFPVYKTQELQQLYPAYISRRFDKEYITPNCFKAIADDIYPDKSIGKPLIEQMVEKGKQWYLLDHFLPDTHDTLKTGYTNKQLDWITANEGNVWSYLIKNENIYSIEPHVIQTYIGEAPFTQGMPEISPGNVGQWIGWRIIKNFAEDNEKLTLQQVLQTPAKTIFQEAKYRPK